MDSSLPTDDIEDGSDDDNDDETGELGVDEEAELLR
jgi:hypothetical protein